MKRIAFLVILLVIGACSKDTVSDLEVGNRSFAETRGGGIFPAPSYGCPPGTHPGSATGSVTVKCQETLSGICKTDPDGLFRLYCHYDSRPIFEGSCPAGSVLEREPKCESSEYKSDYSYDDKLFCESRAADRCEPATTSRGVSFACYSCIPNEPPGPPKPTVDDCDKQHSSCYQKAQADYEACLANAKNAKLRCEMACMDVPFGDWKKCLDACGVKYNGDVASCAAAKDAAERQCNKEYGDCIALAGGISAPSADDKR